MRVLIACGGTGGHINPGIAIADMIKEKYPDAEFLFAGTPKGMESKLVPKAGYRLETIKVAGFQLRWEGEGVDEKGVDAATGKVLVKVNPDFFRPAEVELLLGCPEKAEKALGWKRMISFEELVGRMVRNDIALIEGKPEE